MGKKQHYVPRLLLKGFSTDENHKLIDIFLLNQDLIRTDCGLYEQAQKHNLYGADQKLEKKFEQIESAVSSSLLKLRTENLGLPLEDQLSFKLFTLFQLARTPSAAQQQDEAFTLMVRNLASYYPKLKTLKNDIQVGVRDPYIFLFQIACDMVDYILDLKIGLLKAPKGDSFLIGEHPVVVLNPFLCFKNWPGSKGGIGVKGTIIVIPISKYYTVILYDNLRYSLTGTNNVVELEHTDLNILNYCQVLQSTYCVYFGEPQDAKMLRQFRDASVSYRTQIKSELESYKLLEPNSAKNAHDLIRMSRKDLPISQNFSFFSVFAKQVVDTLGPSMDIRREAIKKLDRQQP
jgi:hypothetical protein